ncbi:hypothetical protein ACW6AV_000364 [Edwardsiella piscicida]|uniref:Uncharacterized protein n=2 Tax=Edwardsiella piscicida TaxID=1263550 RepID=A0AAU8PGM2_EDWPI|nr:hypothetical protein [Edwardsiella piscicida]ACY85079.1 hypothetical protein ETAE_2244 [Edwardsiella tarda EIB202]ELM3656983.1 hypothetical protein [Edwardsiella piscicida]ELM3735286.1 hypothetical protein [Edwardsiella piscicida]MDM3864170.1 hypothetical protein [Edwardsiella piscicida]QBB13522.1 hypothetical protein EVK84_13800 [Edwardsiella piscicida]
MKVFIDGCSWIEVESVKYLLDGCQFSVDYYHDGCNINADDVLIFCLSTMPTLGWASQLGVIDALLRSYGCHIIVLHPQSIPSQAVVLDSRIFSVCGALPVHLIKLMIISAIDIVLHRASLHQIQRDDIKCQESKNQIKELMCSYNARYRSKRLGMKLKSFYGRRLMMVKSLGFNHLHHFRVFTSGVTMIP